MADRGRGRARDHDRDGGAGRGRGRGGSSERPPHRDYPRPDWDDRIDTGDEHRKRAGGGGDDEWRDRRDRREPYAHTSGYNRDRDFIPPQRHDRPPAPPSREGSRDSMSRLPGKVRDHPVPSPRERGMIDKPPAITRPVGPPLQSTATVTQTFTKEGQVQSPKRRASTISNHNEPSPVGRSYITKEALNIGEVAHGVLATSTAMLQSMIQQQQQGEGNGGEQKFIFAELIQTASYAYYRFNTCQEELKAAQRESSKHSVHFPQFPALKERYISVERHKEVAYNEAKKASTEASINLNLFLHELSGSVVSMKNNSEIAKEALKASQDAVSTAEKGSKRVKDLDSILKKLMEQDNQKPPSTDPEMLQKLQDEVKTLRETNKGLEERFKTTIEGYDEQLKRFLATQDGFKDELKRMREERDIEKKKLNGLAEERKREKELEMEIDREDQKAKRVDEKAWKELEARIATMEKALNRLQPIKPDANYNTITSAVPPSDAPPWLPPDFQNKWNALLEDLQKIQNMQVLCDEAVTKTHAIIAEEFGKLQDSVDTLQGDVVKLTSQAKDTSESLEKLRSSTSSALAKVPSDTSTLISNRISELKPQIQQEIQLSWTKFDARLSTVEKSTSSQQKTLEALPQSLQMEKPNNLTTIESRLHQLESSREGIEVALQSINNNMNNFQFKEITEKVAGILGFQRVTVLERELGTLKAQLQALVSTSQLNQKGQVQQVQQQGGVGKQGQMKNGAEAVAITNGITQPSTTPGPQPGLTMAQFQAIQTFQQQQQQQQLPPNLQNTVNTSTASLTTVNARLTTLENNLAHIHSVVHPLTVTAPNPGQLPPRLANLEKRLDAQEAKMNGLSQLSNRMISEAKSRTMEALVPGLKDRITTCEADLSKMHETIATMELKIAAAKTSASEAISGGVMLPEGFLEEYSPGVLAKLTDELHDLKRQFEAKVDNNLKQWATKVKDNIQKINRDLKDLTARIDRIEEITGGGVSSGVGLRGDEMEGAVTRRGSTRREPPRISSLEPTGMGGRESSASRSVAGSRGESMDVDIQERPNPGGGR